MIIVNFENRVNDRPDEFYTSLVEKVAGHILKAEGCPYQCEVSLILTNDGEIRGINEAFRHKDTATDVLSFPNYAFESPADFTELTEYEGDFDYFNPENEAFYLGDIMISEEKALDQAEDYGHSYVREIAFLIAHSVLHLIGYDHMLEEDAAVMEHKQSSYLEELGITREL